MKEVFIVDSVRTPLGSFGGAFSDTSAADLGAAAISGLLSRVGLKGDAIDEVILGQVLTGGSGQAPARQAMRLAGLPDKTHAITINKVCGSGLKAITLAANSICMGDSSVVVAGGMENMSMAPYALDKARYGYRMGNGALLDTLIHDGLLDPYSNALMGVIAEGTADRFRLSREEQDDFAIRSYQLAQKAIANDSFKDEIVQVIKKGKKGEMIVDCDEEPFNVDYEKLKKLKPAFQANGTITAGNASTVSDGAAVSLLVSEEALKQYNLTPKARLVAYATNSIHPDKFAEAPIGAIEKVCKNAGLSPKDIDLYEINEAFAAVPLCAIKHLNLNLDLVNVNGGAVSLGHPLGASGARIVATLLAEMKRRQSRFGLASLCIGGGEGVAVIFERI